MKKERKLTEAELKRKADFEKLSERLESEGYKPNHLILETSKVNTLVCLVTLPLVIIIVVIYLFVTTGMEEELLFDFVDRLTSGYWTGFGLFILSLFIHEGIHGFVWGMFAKNKFKSISFGFVKEALAPYCTCNEPLKKYQMLLGVIMPTVILGFTFGTLAIIADSPVLLVLAVFNIMGGGADIIIFAKLLSYKSSCKDVLFIDHPYEVGTAVFEK